MSDEAPPQNQWLIDAINGAKQSALPILMRELAEFDGLDVDTSIDAIELALLAINGDVTEVKLRDALRPMAEQYAQAIGGTWESVADAILGTMEWTPPDPSANILDSWANRRK